MKANHVTAIVTAVGLCGGLSACGHDHSTPSPPSLPTVTNYSVNDVYVKAQTKSETDDPFAVNGSSVSPSNDETSDPISIDSQ